MAGYSSTVRKSWQKLFERIFENSDEKFKEYDYIEFGLSWSENVLLEHTQVANEYVVELMVTEKSNKQDRKYPDLEPLIDVTTCTVVFLPASFLEQYTKYFGDKLYAYPIL